MKKTVKRLLASLMVAVIILTAAPLSGFVGLELPDFGEIFSTKADAAEYKVGDIIEFGSYPQTEVTDTSLLSALNALSLSWASYGYYTGTGEDEDGQMKPGDYMKYAEVTYKGERYRAVKFTEYRPKYTGCTTSLEDSYQDDNGYYTNTVYWFKFEPLKWRVLDPTNGLILSEKIIDAQAFNNTAYWNVNGDKKIYQDLFCTVYANNYKESSIREWLNNDFYDTAFVAAEKSCIQTTTCDNASYWGSADSATTYDKIFLLSYGDSNNPDYGFSSANSADTARTTCGTQYAKCQGLSVNREFSSVDYGNSDWWLRTAATGGCASYCMNSGHVFGPGTQVGEDEIGVRPALKLYLKSTSDSNKSITLNTYDDYSYCTYIGENRIFRESSDSFVSMGMVTFDSSKISDISKELTWSSSDESILKIVRCNYSKLSNGQYFMKPEITALNEGNATITLTASNGATQSWDVTVYPNEYYLRVCSTDADCSTRVGESITLEVALCKNGSIVKDWKKPAIVIGNGEVVDVTSPYAMNSYKGDYFRYEIDIIGLKKGKSSLTITDMDSGANVVLTITVGETLVSNISYMADNVPSFYPDVLGDRKTQTNIYNCNNLYVNSYSSYAKTDGYHVSFDVYNESYMHGSVDVFDSTGKWIESHKIAKYEDIQSLYDTGKALVFLVAELNKPISYTNHMHSVKTHISIDVPNGGYFTISNNYAQSPGAFIYNSVDYMMLAAETAIDLVVNGVEIDAIAQNVVEQAINSDTMMEVFMKEFHNIALSVSQTALEAGYGEAASALTINAKNIYDSAGISFEGAVETVCGIAEGAFKLATGFIGATLEGLFVFQKMSSYTMQTVELCNSVNKPYITIHSPKQKESTTINGVTVTDTNNAVDSKTVLQVFRIHNDEVLNITLNRENYGFDDYVLYNISFVKNDKEVQPNGRVTVKIPVPDGYSYENSTVLKETDDGWEIINAVCENGFFVFEVNHFCNFAIVKQGKVHSVSINDISMSYKDSATVTSSINADSGVKYTVSYSSSNTDVVSVDSNGRLTTNGTGDATITVTVTDEYGNTVTDTCKVEVSYKWWQWIIVIVLFGWIWY